jgi:hypothetical protein
MGAAIQTHADRVIDGHESIENCVIKMVACVGNLHDAFHKTQEKAEANTTAVQAMITSLEKCISTQDPPPPSPVPTPDSYASRTCVQFPVIHNKVMAHTNDERVRILEWGGNRCIWGCTGEVCMWESVSRYGSGYRVRGGCYQR